MPNDINISTPTPAHAQPSTQEALARTDTTVESSSSSTSSKSALHPSSTLFANPTLQLNADLGIVVIQFRDEAGSLTSQIPSQRQIDAYIAGSAKLPGEHGQSSAQAAASSSAASSPTALSAQAVSNDA